MANALVLVASFVPAARDLIAAHPQEALVAIGLVNGVLRLITKDAIALYGDETEAPTRERSADFGD